MARDYRFTIARGLDAEDDFTASGTATPVLRSGDAAGVRRSSATTTCGLKVGHFYTIIGYEVVTAPDNFFYTHAYTMQYGEPFTHTGVLATYNANDQLQR